MEISKIVDIALILSGFMPMLLFNSRFARAVKRRENWTGGRHHIDPAPMARGTFAAVLDLLFFFSSSSSFFFPADGIFSFNSLVHWVFDYRIIIRLGQLFGRYLLRLYGFRITLLKCSLFERAWTPIRTLMEFVYESDYDCGHFIRSS